MSTSRWLLGDITPGRKLLFSAMTGAGLGMATLGLSSCGGDSTSPMSSGASASVRFMGGQAPVSGISASIYAAGNSTPLLTGTSDANGVFSFSGSDLKCPSSDTVMYIVGIGGNAGNGTNSGIGLSAAFASCSTLQSSGFSPNIDEVTTVASVWALSQFLDATGQMLTAPASGPGLTNAVATIANLADTTAGAAATTLTAGAVGTPPTATINTLANILAACINSAVSTDTSCSTLFANATPPGGNAPTSTLQAAWNIARNPALNVAALFALADGGPFATPVLSSAPPDWTLAVAFTPQGGVLGQSMDITALAIDNSGVLWAANEFSDSDINGGNGYVFAMNPLGVTSTALLIDQMQFPDALAIDSQQQLWVVSTGSVSTLSNGEGSVESFDLNSLSPIQTFGSAFFPLSIAVDPAGNVWWPSNQTQVSEVPLGASAVTTFDLRSMFTPTPDLAYTAIDSDGNVWLSNTGSAAILELPGGSASAAVEIQGSFLTESPSRRIAVGPSGDIWSLNGGDVIVLLQKANGYAGIDVGPSASGDAFNSVATDGDGRAWIYDSTHGGLLVLGPDGSALPGMSGTNGLLTAPTAPGNLPAIDSSGNVWLGGGATIREIIGIATPVQTPLIGNPVNPLNPLSSTGS